MPDVTLISGGVNEIAYSNDHGVTWAKTTFGGSGDVANVATYPGGAYALLTTGYNDSKIRSVDLSSGAVNNGTLASAHTTGADGGVAEIAFGMGYAYGDWGWVYVGSRKVATVRHGTAAYTASNSGTGTWNAAVTLPAYVGAEVTFMLSVDFGSNNASGEDYYALGWNITDTNLFLLKSTNGQDWTDDSAGLPAEVTTAAFTTTAHVTLDFLACGFYVWNMHVHRWQLVLIYDFGVRVFEKTGASWAELTVTGNTFITAYQYFLEFNRPSRTTPMQVNNLYSWDGITWQPIVPAAAVTSNGFTTYTPRMAVTPTGRVVIAAVNATDDVATVQDNPYDAFSFSTFTGAMSAGGALAAIEPFDSAPLSVPSTPRVIPLWSSRPTVSYINYLGVGAPVFTVTYTALRPPSNITVSISDSCIGSETTQGALGMQLFDSASATENVGYTAIWLLLDAALGAVSLDTTTMRVSVDLESDTATAVDENQWVWVLNMQDAGSGTDSLSAQFDLVANLVDTVIASETMTGASILNGALAVFASGSDTVASAYVMNTTDTASSADVVAALKESFVMLADSSSLTDSFTASSSFTVLLTENLQVSDANTVNQILTVALQDNIAAHMFITLGGVTYDAWTMNTENLGVTEYEGFLGTSFAQFGTQYLTTAEGGIYSLDGATDDGALIDATVRTGIDKLGTEYMKRVPNVYIGVKKDGKLGLKVATTDSGDLKRNWYGLRAVQRSVVGDERFDVAKGLKSVYWQLEVTNDDGSDFELDQVKMWRLVLNRRK